MIVVEVVREKTFKVSFVENNYVIETFSPDAANQSFNIGVLSRRTRGSENFIDIEALSTASEHFAVDPVSISQQIPGCGIEGERFVELLRAPLGGWMLCNIEMGSCCAWSVFLHRRFGDIDAQLSQFPNDSRRSPGRVHRPHLSDQCPQLRRYRGSADTTRVAEPSPVVPESSLLPAHDRSGLDKQ